jgi:hypothetical protein
VALKELNYKGPPLVCPPHSAVVTAVKYEIKCFYENLCILTEDWEIFLTRQPSTRVVDEISRNIYFVFREIIFLFREISYREILRNFAKFREISRNFCDEIKVFTG